MNDIYQVCIPHTNRDCFDYEALDLTPCIGGRVWVPFRNQARVGIVINKVCDQQTGHSLKKITSIIDEKPLVPEDLLELCLWVGSYYQSPLSEVIPLVIPKNIAWVYPAHYLQKIFIN